MIWTENEFKAANVLQKPSESLENYCTRPLQKITSLTPLETK